MDVYLLIREDQNDHGFVDTGVLGVFRRREDAERSLKDETEVERRAGMLIDGDPNTPDGEWQVSLRIEEHPLVADVTEDSRPRDVCRQS
jgi:hypothetical protein